MKFIKKYYLLFAFVFLATLYLVLRLTNIMSLPIFTDEAIYVRWAQIASNDANWRFISLTDGKQPSFIWVAMTFMKFISEPLLAGRLVSVIAGLGSMVGIFFLTSELFSNKKIGILASFIYIIFPFSLVYDRLALYDSLVALFIIWSLYFEVLLVRRLRLDLALILGMIIGGGMLTKTNANFAFILLPFTLLLFDFKAKEWKSNLKNWTIYAVVSVIIAQVIYAVLRLSPFFHIISEKNKIFVYPFVEWIGSPFAFFNGNFSALFNWLVIYTTIPFLVLVLSALVVEKRFLKEKILMIAWFVFPFIALSFFGKVIYPRFILFMVMPLIPLAAYTLFKMVNFTKKSYLKVFIFFVFTLQFFITDYFILTDFVSASVPKSDKQQFVQDWPAGNGISQSVIFFEEVAKDQSIFIGTQGTFGLLPFGLEIYLVNNPNITIKAYWPIENTPPADLVESAKIMPTYVVFYQPCSNCVNVSEPPADWPVREIKSYRQGAGSSYYRVYQIQSD